MSDAKQVAEAINIYYKAITVWRYTIYQELGTFQFQVSNQATPHEVMETRTRLNEAVHFMNQHFDQLGELSFSLTEMLNEK